MKFWNYDHDVRLQSWVAVEINKPVQTRAEQYRRLKFKLKSHPSTGRFWFNALSRQVWFEREDDAIICKLTYL